MNTIIKRGLLVAALFSLALIQGCATSVKAKAMDNPPPKEAFSAFGRIQVKTAMFKEGYTGDKAGLAKINENIQKDMASYVESWNKGPENGRTLIIEPIVEEIQFQHGAKRVLLGPLAGSSGVRLRLRIYEVMNGSVASPEFFQRADAMAAGFVFGVHDNLMLTRVANLATGYIIANYNTAKGGPTGADEKALAR
ncbi:hypothetical protein ACO0LF_02270 [Undibacterium sp. Di27W]|uniref:hypothetical protein n=1 Tax=Undibacterium sp. Di27W TaxID=3413036 RepID=UPI003BF1F551